MAWIWDCLIKTTAMDWKTHTRVFQRHVFSLNLIIVEEIGNADSKKKISEIIFFVIIVTGCINILKTRTFPSSFCDGTVFRGKQQIFIACITFYHSFIFGQRRIRRRFLKISPARACLGINGSTCYGLTIKRKPVERQLNSSEEREEKHCFNFHAGPKPMIKDSTLRKSDKLTLNPESNIKRRTSDQANFYFTNLAQLRQPFLSASYGWM